MFSILLTVFFFATSIFIHELGHYLAAKQRGLFVPKFSIGFGPKIVSWQSQETEFCISLLPLGGYVVLPQLVDPKAIEGMYTISKRYKQQLSAYDRIIAAAMGPIFNLLLAFFIASILWIHGTPTLSKEMSTTVGYIFPRLSTPSGEIANPTAISGLQLGDTILSIDDRPVHNFEEIQQAIYFSFQHDDKGQATVQLQIQRGQSIQNITLHPINIALQENSSETFHSIGILPASSLKVSQITPGSSAHEAGILPDDQLLSIDDQALYSLQQLQDYLQKHTSTVCLGIRRKGEEITLSMVTAEVPVTKPYWRLENQAGQEFFSLIPKHFPSTSFTNFAEISLEIGFSTVQRPALSTLRAGDTLLLPHTLRASSFQDMGEFLSATGEKSFLFQKQDGSIYEYPLKDFKVHYIPEITFHRLGIECYPEIIQVHIPPWTQIKNYTAQSYHTLRSLLSHSNVVAQHLMGPPGIFRAMNNLATHNIWSLLAFLVMLNVNLAIINLLPLPVLDGGHIVFAILQKTFKNRLPTQWWYRGQFLFIILLLFFMLYTSFHDIQRWKHDVRNRQTLKFKEQITF
ncbi:MAG: site-2 protease family protein [Puniceicoccales bacterium]|jgi:RIP metalloprotease RseP|nr:site-2 protease family protein [Puniceicoccales bacterium]